MTARKNYRTYLDLCKISETNKTYFDLCNFGVTYRTYSAQFGLHSLTVT